MQRRRAQENFWESASQGRTARFKKRGPSGVYFALEKKKGKGGQRHRQCQHGQRGGDPAVAQLIKNAAIGGLAVGRKKIVQPLVIMAVFVRSPIVFGFDFGFGFGPVNLRNRAVTAGTMNQPMHQAQQGRKQHHQGQKTPDRPHCDTPEDHAIYFTVSASLMR